MPNTLESKLNQTNLRNSNRREFLQTISKYAGLTGLAALAVACGGKSNGNTPSGPSVTPTPITQTIQIYNSDGTDLGKTTYEGTTGQPITITYQNLTEKGINTQRSDPNYFALRENNQGNRLGNYIANTTNGTITTTPTNTEKTLWLMNNTNAADYTGAWNSGLAKNGIRGNNRYQTAIKLTEQNNTINDFVVQDGDMTNILLGLDLLNEAWNLNGVQLASITYAGSGVAGDMKIGIGVSKSIPEASGVHSGNSYIINPKYSNTTLGRNDSASEAFETMFLFDDLFGRGSSEALFGNASGPQMLLIGKDYLRFAALMSR